MNHQHLNSMSRQRPRRSRRGVTLMLMLVVISLLIVIAMVLFDWSRMALVHQQLQGQADVAALAGAKQLANLGLDVPSSASYAQASEQLWRAQHDTAHNQAALVIQENDPALGSAGSEVLVGHLSETGVLAYSGLAACDVVEVSLGRSTARGNAMDMTTARMFGLSVGDVEVRSRAVVKRSVYGFRPSATEAVPCLPLVSSDWEQQLTAEPNAFNDRYATTLTGSAALGEDGVPEIALRLDLGSPSAANGWLMQLAAGRDATSRLASQLVDGLTAEDLDALDGDLVASTLQTHALMDAQRLDPAKLCEVLQAAIGQKKIIPLGVRNSQTNTVKISGFAAGTVVDCYLDGEQTVVAIVQPGALESSLALVDDLSPANAWIGKVVLAN